MIWQHIWILFQRHHGPSVLISFVVVNILCIKMLPAFWTIHKSIQILFQVVVSMFFLVLPLLGQIIQLDEHIFQRG